MKDNRNVPLALGVVGAGRLGRTIMATWPDEIVVVGTRSRDHVPSRFQDKTTDPTSVLSTGSVDLLWLAVPDDFIYPVSVAITEKIGDSVPKSVIHSSGVHGVEPLSPFIDLGVPVGSLHPNLIIDGTTPFPSGAVWGFTGDESALETCDLLLENLEPELVRVRERDRAAYHAAATLAANYPLLLSEFAERLYRRVGLSHSVARTIVLAYLRQIVATLESGRDEKGLDLLTGPVVRGDNHTLERHVEAVREAFGGPEGDLFELLIDTARSRVGGEEE